MYLQITTKCNMKCAHCLFGCAPGSGEHMTYEVAKKAINLAVEYGEYIAIGGGEPTLNPQLIDILGYAILMQEEHDSVFMVTNGTCNKGLWKILMRAKDTNKLILQVSKDPWHDTDMIKDYIWDDADKLNLWWGNKGIKQIVPKGRAAQNTEDLVLEAQSYSYDLVRIEPDCIEVRIDPTGTIYVDGEYENYMIGTLNEENLQKAFDLKSKLEE